MCLEKVGGFSDMVTHAHIDAWQVFFSLKAAKKHGYTRLVLGLSTSRIAVKVISEAAKVRVRNNRAINSFILSKASTLGPSILLHDLFISTSEVYY